MMNKKNYIIIVGVALTFIIAIAVILLSKDNANWTTEVLNAQSYEISMLDCNGREKILDKNTPLFNDKCICTDDSNLTCAIADAVLNNESYEVKDSLIQVNAVCLDDNNNYIVGEFIIFDLDDSKNYISFKNNTAIIVHIINYRKVNIDVFHIPKRGQLIANCRKFVQSSTYVFIISIRSKCIFEISRAFICIHQLHNKVS